jgi:uncharacterized protein YyaL (SSP411 family)
MESAAKTGALTDSRVSDGSSSARPGSLLTRRSRFGWPHYLLLALLSGATSAAQPPASAYPYTNRLIHSLDPYLLLHAHNPVDWYPWGAEALAKAKKENKPIFLSIGYSTCYWCHVAERTIYSNPRIARLMNQWFVNVKVDREQRPDIDQLYMSARQIMTGNGSWPNNLFLTPDLKPFYAGSYFPPADDAAKGPGFPTVLQMLHESWLNERPKVDAVAQEVFTDLLEANQRAMNDAAAKIDPKSWLADARDTLLQMMDRRHGGIADSGGTRFPRSPELGLLLTDYQANHDEAALSALTETLDAIAYGGIHDHLAGGFHRYSTEPTWSIPHFEKMLSDNAQLLGLYTRSFQLTGNPLYRAQALATAHYLESDMMAVGGGFYGAQDAEVNGVEGASYLWTRNQIASVLGEAETQRFLRAYELTGMPDATGTLDDRPGVLRIRLPIESTLQQSGMADAAELLAAFAPDRARLLALRSRRKQPLRDEKIVVGTNGLVISALAQSGKAFDQPPFITWARLAATRIWSSAYDPHTHSLRHEIFRQRAQTPGYLQDYALLGSGYLALARATGEGVWRARARLLADEMLHRFARADGSLSSTLDEANLLVPMTDDGDSDTPSGTSAAIDLLQQCAVTFGDTGYADAAYRAARPISGRIERQPSVWPAAVIALNSGSATDVPADRGGTVQARAQDASARGEFHFPVTADHVHVSAATAIPSASDTKQIEVTINVDDGYHINANPASFDYLVATAVSFDRLTPSNVIYPQAHSFQSSFAPEGIAVLEGTVKLMASFPANAALRDMSGTVKAQACDAQSCLPPSELRFSIGAPN